MLHTTRLVSAIMLNICLQVDFPTFFWPRQRTDIYVVHLLVFENGQSDEKCRPT